MNIVKFGDIEKIDISALTLGTVQFGMNYGIANESGKPPYENSRDIIACAVEGGVTCLDTAAAYGDSEEILGRAMDELKIRDKVTIVSKVPPHPDKKPSAGVMDEHCAKTIEQSLKNLKLDYLPMCLLHHEGDSEYLESLCKCVDRGLVKYVGCSTSTPQKTLEIVNSELASAVQIPLNFMDKRFTDLGVLKAAEQKGVAVFTRSLFLQGLAVMDIDAIETRREIVPEIDKLIEVRRAVDEVLKKYDLSIVEAAVRYVLGIEGVTSVLCGVDTVSQMKENLELFSKGPLEKSIMDEIRNVTGSLGDETLDPRHWNIIYGKNDRKKRT